MSGAKPASQSFALQERDLAILRGLFESRVMTSRHVEVLHFDGKREAARKRLQKLKAASYIGERSRMAFELSTLFLLRKGLELLDTKGILAEYPAFSLPALENRARVSEQTIRHELEVMDVKVAFHAAVRSSDALTISEFTTWPLLHEFRAFLPGGSSQETLVKPDGFIFIRELQDGNVAADYSLFLELDRSTETLDVLVDRALRYLDHFKSGGFAKRKGALSSEYKLHPFRVLMVFKTAERRNNVAERLINATPPILSLAYLSTYPEVTSDPLGQIWMTPGDYRAATEGTPFDVRRKVETWGYKRQTERELFIEANVKKIGIIEKE